MLCVNLLAASCCLHPNGLAAQSAVGILQLHINGLSDGLQALAVVSLGCGRLFSLYQPRYNIQVRLTWQ